MHHLILTSSFLFSCRSEEGVKVYNSVPQVTITSHAEGAELQDGYTINFLGQVSDANHDNNQLLVTWATNNGALCSERTPQENGETSCEAILREDDTELRLQAIDPEGGAGIQTISIQILPTAPPIAEILSPLPSGVYYSDQLITFEGLIADEEDEAGQLIATWESTIDGELDVETRADSDGTVLGYGYLTEGEHAIELYVEDSTEKTDTASVIIHVGPPNSAPQCSITSPDTSSAGPENQNIDFTAAVSDADIPSNQLAITWESDKDGSLGSSTPNSSGDVLFSFSDLSVNTHTITITVTDEIGASCTDFISYTVGTHPEIQLDTPIDGNVFAEGSSINFSATVSDAQDQANDIALDWTLNGVSVSTQGATSSGTASWSDSNLSSGSYTLLVTATDTDGLTDSTQTSFTVNGIPSAPEIYISPNPANTANQLSTNISTPSIDPEGSPVSYTYEWFKNNVPQTTQTAPIVASTDTEKGEIWTIRVTPNDGLSNGDYAEAQITISNTAPSLSSIAITPTGSTYNDEVIHCSVVVTDPDETLSPFFEWSIDGLVVGTGSTLDLANVGAAPNNEVRCTASVIDDEGESASTQTSTTLSNRTPFIDSLVITPANPDATTAMFTCVVNALDEDGESPILSYTWSIDGSTLPAQTTSSLSGSYDYGQIVSCTATPADALSIGAPAPESVIIGNTLPFVDSVLFDGSQYHTNDVITATAIISDIDSTQASALHGFFEWHILDFSDGNSDKIVQSGSNNLLDGSIHFDRDDEVYVIITPNDGIDDGITVSSSRVQILNTAPTTASVSISPTLALAEVDDLICSIDVPSTDIDGDGIVYDYTWFDPNGVVQQNSTASASTQDVYLSTGTTQGVWTCAVTPYDMTDYAPPSSATVTVENGCSSLDFDGVDDYVDITLTQNQFDFGTGDFTVGVYFSVDTLGGTQQILSKYDLELQVTASGTLQAYFQRGGCGIMESTTTIGTQQWIYANIVRDAGTTYMYINGTLVQSGLATSCNTNNTHPLTLGTDIGGGEAFDGQIASIAGWNYALSQTEIQSYMGHEFTGAETGLVGAWETSNYGNGMVRDIISSDDGTINGSTWIDRCPNEDIDEDGFAAWEDCDDLDPTLYSSDSGANEYCVATSCLSIFDDGYSSGDGTYWINPTGLATKEVYCDMTTDGGGWALVGVALVSHRGQAGWNDEGALNTSDFTDLNAHWHYSSSFINNVSTEDEFRAICFDSTNNYTRYWHGVTDYNWSALTSASSTWNSYPMLGVQYATSWASHHYGLVSGNNETDTLITSHSGNEWACGGYSGPNGEGYTGRGGISNFRLWVK